jgi:hypothetical protein
MTALLFTAYSIPVGLLDNVLKPFPLGRGLDISIIVILIGVIGGTLSYGFSGLFLGPIVLAVIWKLLIAWISEESANQHPGATSRLVIRNPLSLASLFQYISTVAQSHKRCRRAATPYLRAAGGGDRHCAPPIAPAIAIANRKSATPRRRRRPRVALLPARRASSPRGPRLARAEIHSEYGQRR